MAGDDERDQDSKRQAVDESLAAAETRMIDADADSGGGDVDGDARVDEATRLVDDQPAEAPAEVPAAAEAETVLAEDDDRTQLVTRAPAPSEAPEGGASESPATRVLDPAARPGGAAEEDKTSPPAVSGRPTPSPGPAEPDRGLRPGAVLFGEYEIVNVLGVGGMGEVYRARHRRLDEHRAIKVMHADLSKKKGASEFFYREAKALLAVRHPAVVHCHDLLSDDEGRVYLIMEMIEGIPLSQKMNDGPLSPDDVATLGARVAHGLAAAHRKGVIHRDVSPDNIVLPDGDVREAKIIDFGIAKLLEEGEGTIVDGFKGKLSYASPEQLGFFGGQIDGRSDFYSLGLVLAAAALGRPMGMGTTVMEAVDARRGFSSLPDEIPMGLRSAIQPLLALDPNDRPKYVDRLFVVPGGVEGVSQAGGAWAEPVAGPAAGAAAGGLVRRWAPLAAGLIGALGLAGGVAVYATGGFGGREATPAAALAPERVAPEGTAAVEPVPAESAGVPTREQPVIEAPAPAPVKPAPKRVTGRDRIKIIGLLNNAGLALDENRLMSPAGNNAYERYRRVLDLDPANRKARDGLRLVADRYLRMAESAVASGDPAKARTYVERARRADVDHPGLAAAEERLAP